MPIPNIKNNNEWCDLTTGAYCNYDNNPEIVKEYGRLYNHYAVTDSNNIAPEGWHVPTYDEFEILEDYLNHEPTSEEEFKNILIDLFGIETYIGGKYKEIGTNHWKCYEIGASNSSGLTALPGGLRREEFSGIGEVCSFWLFSHWSIDIQCGFIGGGRSGWDYYKGRSVRCIKDVP